jgi:hypothetical protein
MPDFSTRVKTLYFRAWIGLFSGVEPLYCYRIRTEITGYYKIATISAKFHKILTANH